MRAERKELRILALAALVVLAGMMPVASRISATFREGWWCYPILSWTFNPWARELGRLARDLEALRERLEEG